MEKPAVPQEAKKDSTPGSPPAQAAHPPLEEQKTEGDVWGLGGDEQQGNPQAVESAANLPANPPRGTFRTSSTDVRIVLVQNAQEARIVASSDVDLRNGGTPGAVSFRGSAAVERGDAAGRVFLRVAGQGRMGIVVPCTLSARSEFCLVTIDDVSYRGSIIVAPGPGGLFTLINYLDVEDYLRGVVPLEVGKGSDEVAEAVKAQAVAARTYTFRKMQENAGGAWDMAATVADQVYGGVTAEDEQCSRAVRETAGQVMLWRDSLIFAYYHSTCGGRTANIEDVWNKSTLWYLRSRDDNSGISGPYCASSPSFEWDEQWPLPQFTFIVNRYSREAFPQAPSSGEVRSVSVGSRFRCGRAKQVSVRTGTGTFEYGGDKIRFVFRRNSTGYPILKSSIITDVSVRAGTVEMKGRGYGHGVGMCQMGALGRARTGKKYDEILKAYYTDIVIRKVTK